MSTDDPPDKRGPGRPPAEAPRTEFLRIRLTKAELADVTSAAEAAAAKNPSEWARARILAAAKRTKPKVISTEHVTETEVVVLPDGAGHIRHRVVQPGDIITHIEQTPGDVTDLAE